MNKTCSPEFTSSQERTYFDYIGKNCTQLICDKLDQLINNDRFEFGYSHPNTLYLTFIVENKNGIKICEEYKAKPFFADSTSTSVCFYMIENPHKNIRIDLEKNPELFEKIKIEIKKATK